MSRRSKTHRTMGLDQLGPGRTFMKTDGLTNPPSTHNRSLRVRASTSSKLRKVKITLPNITMPECKDDDQR